MSILDTENPQIDTDQKHDSGKKSEESKTDTTFSVVSLFSGCGGFDLGIMGGFDFCGQNYPATSFKVVWANDIDRYACKIYRQNISEDIIEADINNLNLESLPKDCDVLLGGFPCQDFSVAGRRKGLESERGLLYRSMVEAVKIAQPRVFVAENVFGLVTLTGALNKIKEDFEEVGYHGVMEYVWQAADFGVPQNRRRVFIIGWKDEDDLEKFEFPNPESFPDMSTKQAIDDLASYEWGEFDGHTWALAKRRKDLQGNEIMPADGFAYTIRAEHHMNIQFHYSLPRRVSVREAARLQTFPDTFLLGDVSKHQGYRMIGNAVPPLMAYRLAEKLEEALQ